MIPLGRYLSGAAPAPPNLNVHGAQNYVTERRAAEVVARWTHQATIVGAVPNFDTEAPVRRREPDRRPWKSEDLSRRVGVEPPGEDERHTALGDARWAERIYNAIMDGGESCPSPS